MKRPLFVMLIGLVLGELCGYLLYFMGVLIPACLFLPVLLYYRTNRRSEPIFFLILCLMGSLSWSLEEYKVRKVEAYCDAVDGIQCEVRGKIIKYKYSQSRYTTFYISNPTIILLENDREEGLESFIQNNGSIENHVISLWGQIQLTGKCSDEENEAEVRKVEEIKRVEAEGEETKVEESRREDSRIEESLVKDYLPGDSVIMRASLSFPESPRNPGGFNEKVYFLANGIYMQGFYTSCDLLSRPVISVRRCADMLRRQIMAGYEEELRKEDSAVLSAMVFGDKSNLDRNQRKLFEENGMMHLLAVSGLHISIVGGRIYRKLRKMECGYMESCLLGGLLLIFYACMAGFGGSVIRAMIMYLIFLLSEYTGMSYDLISSMSLSGILMLLEQPYRLLDSSFLISYVSVFAIGYVIPVVEKRLFGEVNAATGRTSQKQISCKKILCKQISNKQISYRNILDWIQDCIIMNHEILIWIGRRICASGLIFLITFPLTMRFYYEITPYAILLNPIVLPCMPLLMISSMAAGMISMILEMICLSVTVPFRILCLPAVLILRFYRGIFAVVRQMAGAVWITGCPRISTIVTIYIMEGIAIYYIGRNRVENRAEAKKMELQRHCKNVIPVIILLACFLLVRWTNWAWGICFQNTRITMLDVGQGDCILIQMPHKKTMLIDGGSTTEDNIYTKVIRPALLYYGISSLDYVTITHMDQDHISGIEELLQDGYPVGNLLLSPTYDGKNYLPVNQLEKVEQMMISYADSQGSKVHFLQQGDDLKIGNVNFHCLHPQIRQCYADRNDKSLVLYMENDDFSALFTGDLSSEQEKYLIKQIKKPVNLLKVGHHGSKYSTGDELLHCIQAEYAIISAGKGNRYGHPHGELLERLWDNHAKVYVTKDVGAICVNIHDDKVEVDGYAVDS